LPTTALVKMEIKIRQSVYKGDRQITSIYSVVTVDSWKEVIAKYRLVREGDVSLFLTGMSSI
jgi:hypothetical protein